MPFSWQIDVTLFLTCGSAAAIVLADVGRARPMNNVNVIAKEANLDLIVWGYEFSQ